MIYVIISIFAYLISNVTNLSSTSPFAVPIASKNMQVLNLPSTGPTLILNDGESKIYAIDILTGFIINEYNLPNVKKISSVLVPSSIAGNNQIWISTDASPFTVLDLATGFIKTINIVGCKKAVSDNESICFVISDDSLNFVNLTYFFLEKKIDITKNAIDVAFDGKNTVYVLSSNGKSIDVINTLSRTKTSRIFLPENMIPVKLHMENKSNLYVLTEQGTILLIQNEEIKKQIKMPKPEEEAKYTDFAFAFPFVFLCDGKTIKRLNIESTSPNVLSTPSDSVHLLVFSNTGSVFGCNADSSNVYEFDTGGVKKRNLNPHENKVLMQV